MFLCVVVVVLVVRKPTKNVKQQGKQNFIKYTNVHMLETYVYFYIY